MTMTQQTAQAMSGWLGAIAEVGWGKASVDRAAAGSGLSEAEILRDVGDRVDAVVAFLQSVANEAASVAAGPGGTRSRLFDGVMQGFDGLQARRKAVLKLWDSRDPGLLALAAGLAPLALRRLAVAAGVDVRGLQGQLRLLALAALVGKAFAIWREDESNDMAATMAEVDRLLAKAEKAETEGFSPALVGLSGWSNPFDRARRSLPDQ